MGARAQLHQWRLRWTGRIMPWLVAAALLAVVDYAVAPTWGVCVLHIGIGLLAFQMLSRSQIPQLIIALLIFTIIPYVIRPPYDFEPIRVWVILVLLAAAYSHIESQWRRKRRLYVRQQLQRRVRRRTLQIRRINDALRREISRRQATQQRLNRAEMHLQSLAQRMQLQVIRKDLNGVITYANEAFCRGLGRSVDEVIGATDADLYTPTLASAYRYDDERVIQSGQTVDHIESHPTADGQTGWVQVFKAPEFDDENRVTGIQIVFWDVTDTYRKTAELRRSEARKRALFDAAREAVLLVDDAGVVVEANPAAVQLLVSGNGPLAGQHLDQIVVPESALQSLGEGATEPGGTENTEPVAPREPLPPTPLAWSDLPFGERREVLLRPATRGKFPAEVSVNPIPLENSIGLAIFVRDVTLRHQALEALQQAKGAAEEASRIKSEFMASVSHEIRTPLGGITGSAELLCQMDLPPKALQYVEMIRHSGELLSNVIGDILDFTSIEAGRLQITPEPTDLHRCVGEAFRSLATRALGKDLELVLAIAPDVPRQMLIDANRLRQIVINLAGNAIKFTPAGYVLLRVGVETGQVPGLEPAGVEHPAGETPRFLRLEMIDSGIGIAGDRLEKIFEPFEQGDSGTTRHFGGTGLGLSISDKLVRRMGGTIQVISRPGHGSTFRCFIPLQSPDETPVEQPSPVTSGETPAGEKPPGETGVALKIRHPVQRKAIGDLLLSSGFRIDPEASTRIIDQSFAKPRVPGQRTRRGAKTIWIARVDEPTLPDQDPRQPVLLKPILPDDLLRLLRSDSGGPPPPRLRSPALDSGQFLNVGTREQPGIYATQSEPAAMFLNPPVLLLVDDSPVNQAVIRDFLTGAGFQVDLASCGQDALIATRQRRYACVLMDLQMPGMDGIEAMRRIVQEYDSRQQTPPPFIALTAHATQEHRQRCLGEGMKAFLVKPIDRNLLVETVAKWLDPTPGYAVGPTIAAPTAPAEPVAKVAEASESESESDTPATTPPDALADESPRPTDDADAAPSTPPAAAPPAAEPGGDDQQWQKKLIRSAGGDPATIQALVEAFLIEVPQLCQSLQEAVESRDAALARRAAHTLKSCLRYIAPDPDWQQALEIENAAQQNDLETVQQRVPAMIENAEGWIKRLEAERGE